MMRRLLCCTLLAFTHATSLSGGELYFTGFEDFVVGEDTISGADRWTGSLSHSALGLSGVDAEADHLVIGIGNAAFIGGRAMVFPAGVTNRTVNIRQPFMIDPVALGHEVVQFNVNFGIKDSTGNIPRRDNFEFAIYNQDQPPRLIAFLQFDNSTLDSETLLPEQKIWRSHYNGTALVKMDTSTNFLYDVLMRLSVRINFRTNRWTAVIDGLPLFSDQTFYSGPNPRALGAIAAQMYAFNTAVIPGGTETGPAPGDNYMLFDNFAVRMDPVPDPVFYSQSRDPETGAMRLTWLTEALYTYQVQYTDSLEEEWKSDLPESLFIAQTTGVSPVFIDPTTGGASAPPRRFYRVIRSIQ